MAIIQERLPYEILIRFDTEGKVKGAHQQFRQIIRDGGTILKDEPELVVEPVSSADLKGAGVMKEIGASAVEKVNTLQAQVDNLEKMLSDFRSENRVLADQNERNKTALEADAAAYAKKDAQIEEFQRKSDKVLRSVENICTAAKLQKKSEPSFSADAIREMITELNQAAAQVAADSRG